LVESEFKIIRWTKMEGIQRRERGGGENMGDISSMNAGRLKKNKSQIRNLITLLFFTSFFFMFYNYWTFFQSHFYHHHHQQQQQQEQSFLRKKILITTKNEQIPRLIHQSWKNTNQIPDRFLPWMQSWLKKHPTNWAYIFWTDEENLLLFEKKFPFLYPIAKKMGKIGLADMARYALLYEIGGLYVDADFECLKSFDDLHLENEVFLSSEPLAHTVLLEHSTTELALCNALMASRPRHPFWLKVLEKIKKKYENNPKNEMDPVSLTGPRIVKETYLDNFQSDQTIRIFPQEFFYPEIAYWNIENMKKNCHPKMDNVTRNACEWLDKYPHGQHTKNTHAVHHWQCTWCQGENTKKYVTLQEIFEPFFENHEDFKWKIVRPIIVDKESNITFEPLFY
jgi:mannosyltransferase OCH1-like enzyme